MSQPWSKAGLSIGGGLLLLTTLWHRRPLGTFGNSIGKSTGLFLLALLVSVFVSNDVGQGWDNYSSFWPIGFLFFGAAAVRDAENPRLYLWAFLGSALVGSTIGLWHIVEGFIELGHFAGTAEVPTNIWLYSLSMSAGVICALILMRGKSRVCQGLLLAAALSQLLAVFATRRRMTLLVTGLLVMAMIPYFLRRSKLALIALAALIGLGTWMLASDYRVKRITTLEAFFEGERTRTALWQFGFDTFKDSPMTGTGLGDFRDDLHEFAATEGKERYPGTKLKHAHCHNNFLQVAATSGAPGLITFLLWSFALPIWVFRRRRWNKDAAFLALAAWFTLFAAGFTDAPLFSSSRLSCFTLLFGYAWGMMLRSKASSDATEALGEPSAEDVAPENSAPGNDAAVA
jgi:O-antigen ligase